MTSSSAITTLHPDIVHSHILTRLDGPTLASVAAASSHLRRLCTEHHLWQNICTAMWPSLNHPFAAAIISTFPACHRSIFSDSFPSLHYHSSSHHPTSSLPPLPELISAVDLYYKGKPVFSRVNRTETQNGWFLCSSLWVELLEPNESASTTVKFAQNGQEEEWLKHLEESLSLSWIVIDPTRKRAGNLSSRRPVVVRRNWLTGEVEVVYAVVIGVFECIIKVTCCGKVGGEMQVMEASLTMEDMEGRRVVGSESMVILQGAMENGKRKKVDAEEAKANFDKFCSIKREKRETRMRRERALDMLAMLVAFTVFAFLFCLVRFCV